MIITIQSSKLDYYYVGYLPISTIMLIEKALLVDVIIIYYAIT